MSGPPPTTPLGLRLTRSAKLVERAFNDAMAGAGGSAPMWLILVACKTGGGRNQNELASSIGIRGATLTHHLDTMEQRELLYRRRDPDNRRIHIIELTAAGEQMFHRLRQVAIRFDQTLRRGVSDPAQESFETVLDTLLANLDTAGAEQSRESGRTAAGT